MSNIVELERRALIAVERIPHFAGIEQWRGAPAGVIGDLHVFVPRFGGYVFVDKAGQHYAVPFSEQLKAVRAALRRGATR